jgi:hypothetical protein
VEEILSEAFGWTHLQLIERGADVGEAHAESLQCSVSSFQDGKRAKAAASE